MASPGQRPGGQGGDGGIKGKDAVFGVLVLYVVAISFAQVWAAHGGIPRLAGYSVLAPLVAGALLSLRQTLVIALVTVVAMVVTYGLIAENLTLVGRLVAIMLVTLGTVVGIVVCRIRLSREIRISRLMVARDRLRLLSVASTRIGSTLDVGRTAWDLAEVAVPGFADFVAVDLFDDVLGGNEPPGHTHGAVEMRRVAQRSVFDGTPEAIVRPGGTARYDEHSLVTRCLVKRHAVLTRLPVGEDAGRWLTSNPRRAERARRFGFHSAIAVPLVARGTALGVTVFIRHQQEEPFDNDDVLLAEEIGARAAVCVDNARRYTHEHRTSLTLQQSLLPRRLPDVSAVEVATRYLPTGTGGEVGGDWFDVIQLSGARVALVVGDVVGHGLYASATMGRLRSAIRTLADIDLPPDELLTHVDDVLIRLRAETGQEETRGEIGATCLYAVYDPVSRTCTMARAGHPAPVMVLPDGRVDMIEVPAGPPLGLGGLPFESTRVMLPEDSLLALYTKGLLGGDQDKSEEETAAEHARGYADDGRVEEAVANTTAPENTADEPSATVRYNAPADPAPAPGTGGQGDGGDGDGVSGSDVAHDRTVPDPPPEADRTSDRDDRDDEPTTFLGDDAADRGGQGPGETGDPTPTHTQDDHTDQARDDRAGDAPDNTDSDQTDQATTAHTPDPADTSDRTSTDPQDDHRNPHGGARDDRAGNEPDDTDGDQTDQATTAHTPDLANTSDRTGTDTRDGREDSHGGARDGGGRGARDGDGDGPDGVAGEVGSLGGDPEALQRLCEALRRPAPTLEVACDTVLETMLPDGPTDDVALLLARTHVLDASHVASWEMPGDPSAVGRARDLATQQLKEWGMEEAVFTTELVISELVTNAVRHAGGGPIQLRVIRERSLICEVSDTSSTSPHLRRARSTDENGRGLFIVAQLTDRWGTRQTPTGKTIWAELSPSGPPVSSGA